MDVDQILAETEVLVGEVEAIMPAVVSTSDGRFVTSRVACSLSLEHWLAVQALLVARILPSAVVVHRAQFEAVVRAIWLLHAANEHQVEKLACALTPESEQAAKNIASIHEMITDIEKRGPAEAFNVLARFRDNALKPMNSYVHAGVHPLHRHASGYPDQLIADVLKNANGVAMIAWMHAVVLEGRQDIQKAILQIVARHPSCMPSRL